MKKIAKKYMILPLIFILALAVYFVLSQRESKNDVTYTAIEDANLPIAYMQMFGRETNCLYGFVEDNLTAAGRSLLTVLPEDRQLHVSFYDVDSSVKGMQYEIRSLDGERLVERTALENWNQEGGAVSAVLPIQNLLAKDEEYVMTLAIATENHPAVYYYTRIVWTDNNYVQDMLNLAVDFSSKTMDYDAAKDLTTYLETDAAADNSSLGRVTLKSSFNQLTWRGLEMQREGQAIVELSELQGVLGIVNLSYVASRTKEDGRKEYFDVTESFTMKWNEQRIYMMDYDRRTNQIFSGDDNLYTNKRIMLGITDEEQLRQVSDASGKYKAFVANRALWCYNAEENKESSTKIFAFRKSEEDIRADFAHHGIKILSVEETGTINFLVYGYMNRGNHEGTTGVAVYRYENESNTLTEILYLPSGEDYWSLKQDMERLSYLSESKVLYLLMDHAVYGVDLTSREYMVVADGLTEENFAVSSDASRISWQEGGDVYASGVLQVMNLQTGSKNEVRPSDKDVIRLVGFVGNDLVYGLAKQEERLISNGRMVGIPLYALEIVGTDMEVQTRYEKPGVFITDVEIQDSRVHLMKMAASGAGFVKTEEDTLVCNEQVTLDPLEGMGYLAAPEEGKIYFVQLDEEDKKEQKVRLHVPKKVVAEENNVIELKANQTVRPYGYFAYSQGRMNGSYGSFAKAVQAAYDGMGIVTDANKRVVWVRANRSVSRNVRDVHNYVAKTDRYLEELSQGADTAADGTKIIDARGCSLNQVLYFIFRGMPVTAYVGGGNRVIIYGYDQYNISYLWNPGTESEFTDKMGLNDAAAFFETNGENDFVCFLEVK